MNLYEFSIHVGRRPATLKEAESVASLLGSRNIQPVDPNEPTGAFLATLPPPLKSILAEHGYFDLRFGRIRVTAEMP